MLLALSLTVRLIRPLQRAEYLDPVFPSLSAPNQWSILFVSSYYSSLLAHTDICHRSLQNGSLSLDSRYRLEQILFSLVRQIIRFPFLVKLGHFIPTRRTRKSPSSPPPHSRSPTNASLIDAFFHRSMKRHFAPTTS